MVKNKSPIGFIDICKQERGIVDRLGKDFCLIFTHLFTADASPIVPRTIMPDSRVSEKIDHLKMLNGPPQEIADQVRRPYKSFLIKLHEKDKSNSVY